MNKKYFFYLYYHVSLSLHSVSTLNTLFLPQTQLLMVHRTPEVGMRALKAAC